MYRMLIVVSATALLLNACVVAPALPLIVELDVEPYYYQGGYYYYYDNNFWRYSNSKSGPWTDLPRSHYPKETRFKGRAGGRERDQDHDRREQR
jgi:hypothetical protein